MPPRFHIPRRTHTRPRLPPRALNPRVSEGNKNLVGEE
uniref:Uncharacterized protein n=1 Tax=Brassica oleracea TaxID=3712 RepID=A0A3P6ERS4_BRAOL|nr:unnamed protein product [Brassica oleracea]